MGNRSLGKVRNGNCGGANWSKVDNSGKLEETRGALEVICKLVVILALA